MMPTWDDLANGARWRGVVSFIRNWVGPFDASHGMPPEELEAILRAKRLDLPAAVREWYRLAGQWDQGGLNVWIRPGELAASDGMVWILTDPHGIIGWGVRAADVETDDPPVWCREGPPNEVDFPTFSQFVAAMVVNDVILDHEAGAPAELDPGLARTDLTCLVSARCGEYYADAALKSATVVAFAYPARGRLFGKARTPAGEERLQRLRLHPA